MKTPGWLVGVYVVATLIWGPNPSFFGVPYLVKVLYVVVLPVVAWLVLSPIWRERRPDAETDYRLFRIGAAVIAAALFVGAGLAAFESTHQECTKLIKVGHQEAECVGEYVTVSGPDQSKIILLALAGGFLALVSWKADRDYFNDPHATETTPTDDNPP